MKIEPEKKKKKKIEPENFPLTVGGNGGKVCGRFLHKEKFL